MIPKLDRSMPVARILATALLFIPALDGFALTGGPAMPEYAKFEQVGADNLVDPASGNFNYVIPLLDVPGPAGAYPLSLSYHSGIQHGQEATWVGLGWTLNQGAINRVVRGVPDDYLNSITTTWNKFADKGGTVNVGASYCGFGLSTSFDMNNGSMIGVQPSYTLPIPGPVSVTLTPTGFAIGIGYSVGMVGAGVTLYDSQTGGPGKIGWSVAGASVSKGVGVTDVGKGSLSRKMGGFTTPPIYGVSLSFGYCKWKYVLDDHVDDHMCGFLYQDANASGFVDQPSYWPAASGPLPQPFLKGTGNSGGVTSGVAPPNSEFARQRFERSLQRDLIYPSSDIYMVSANGLGGSFEPLVKPPLAGATAAVPEYLDGNPIGSTNRDNEGWYVKNPAPMSRITFHMNGDLGGNVMQEATRPASQIDPYIWDYTTDAAGNKIAKPFGDQYNGQRIVPVFYKNSAGTKVISSKIRGFRIYNTDGMIYEFLQPLHDVFSADMIFEDKDLPTATSSVKYSPERGAYSWLLTSVKGADYVSQENVNSWEAVPKTGDLGHWVNFTYTTPKTTTFATPYSGNMPHEDAEASTTKLRFMKGFGIKEVAFLKSVETETHRADFTTELRKDGLPNRLNIWEKMPPADLTNPARGNADMFVSARGVPRIWLPADSWHTVYNWADHFELPGDWKTPIDKCNQNPPNGNAELCKLIQVEVKINYEQDNKFLDYSYDWYGTSTNGFAGVYNITVNGNGNTEFDAGATITMGTNQHMRSVQTIRAAVNWSRLYAYLGNSINLNNLPYANPDAAPPLIVNRLLRKIDLFRKDTPGHPGRIIKTIDFGYDYSLCPGTPNSIAPVEPGAAKGGGKLTLKSVKISAPDDGNPETTESMMPYQFTYQQGASTGNPEYGDEYKKDVWGMYSKNGSINNHLVQQPAIGVPDAGEANPGVCWNLKTVKTPSGGTISVSYTRDQYQIAGLAKTLASGTQFILPDLYANAPPQLANGDLDVSALTEIKPSFVDNSTGAEHEPLFLASQLYFVDMAKGTHSPQTGVTNHIRKKPEGPTKPNFIKFAAATPDIVKGDMLLVVYQTWYQLYDKWDRLDPSLRKKAVYAPVPLTTGVLNLVFVEDITADGYKVKPLLTADDDGTFYVYKDYIWNDQVTLSAQVYEHKFYAYNLSKRKTLLGGDVAVTSIELDDRFGNGIKKEFKYDALDIRNSGGLSNLCTGCGTASGATFGLPNLYWAKYYRFIPVGTAPKIPTAKQLRMETYYTLTPSLAGQAVQRLDPLIMQDNPDATVLSQNYNPFKTLVDEAFFTERRDGGYYWPGVGISYARTREYYTATVGGAAYNGEIEYQFNNLNHKQLNESGALGDFNNLVDNSNWIAAKTSTAFNLTNSWASKKGQMMRLLKRSAAGGNPIVYLNEPKYASSATTYAGPASADIKTGQLLGWTRQTFISNIAGGAKTITVDHPAYFNVGNTQKEDGVGVSTDYLAFDPRSGEAVAIKKTNSDGTGFVDYQEPGYQKNADLGTRNRWKVTADTRKYKLNPGEGFDRTGVAKVISANYSVWSSDYNGFWKNRSTPIDLKSKAQPPIKSEEYDWKQPIDPSTGLAELQFTPFSGTSGSGWSQTKFNTYFWRNCSPVQTQNPSTGDKALIIPLPNSSNAMAAVSGADFNEVLINTWQFEPVEEGWFLNHHNFWTTSGGSAAVVAEPIAPFSDQSWKLNPGTYRSHNVDLHPSGKKGLYVSLYLKTAGAGGTTLTVTPLDANSVAIAGAQSFDLNSYGYAGRRDIPIDWSSSSYNNAKKARIEFQTGATDYLWINDLRVTPPKAMVNTFYYDDATMAVGAILDEAGSAKIFKYDGLGRLVEKRNSNGEPMEKTVYRNYQE